MSIIINHDQLIYKITTVKRTQSGSHYPGEMATRIDYYPAGDKYHITNPACFARAAMGHLWDCSGNAGVTRGRLIRNQPKRQVAQALLALGNQLRVPAHSSFLQKARQPSTCRPASDLLGFAVQRLGGTY